MSRYKKSYTDERRTEKVTVQFTPSERAKLEGAAAESGATLSLHIRELLLRRLPGAGAGMRRNPQAVALMDELHRAGMAFAASGNLLNQIARHLHMTDELDPFGADLRDALIEHRRTTELYKDALRRVIEL
jgi:hypothetical protein